MDFEEAKSTLGIENEVNRSVIKKNFRRLCFLNHPDVGGSVEKFNTIKEAYELLIVLNFSENEAIDGCEIEKTVCGIPLSELGLGLPITISAKYCDCCDGSGYVSNEIAEDYEYVGCTYCNGEGVINFPCKKCGGDGKFKRNGKVVGLCYLCGGTGRFYPVSKFNFYDASIGVIKRVYIEVKNKEFWVRLCMVCDGNGRTMKPAGKKIIHHKCSNCDGTGETEIYNPVLPRGYLASNGVAK